MTMRLINESEGQVLKVEFYQDSRPLMGAPLTAMKSLERIEQYLAHGLNDSGALASPVLFCRRFSFASRL